MPGLSFNYSNPSQEPIAIVKGRKGDNAILYLDPRDVAQLQGQKPIGDNKIELSGSEVFEPLPYCNSEKRSVWYIAGASGSGKSYMAKTVIDYYHKLFPDRDIFLCSSLDKDATLDTLKYLKRIKPQSFVDDFPELEEFTNCAIVFDDLENLPKKELEIVQKVIDLIASQGRHTNTSLFYLRHTLTDYKQTRLMLGEMTHTVIYPLTTSKKQIENLVGNYVGIDVDRVMELRKTGTRWITMGKRFPMYIITQKSCELANV